MKNILTQEQISEITHICEQFNITGYTFLPDGSIDVKGNVNLMLMKIETLPLKFNKVDGDFDCNLSSLISLKGAPIEVTGNFICNNNKLKSLAGCPTKVGGDFNCSVNQLRSLVGGPVWVGGDYNCSRNLLSTLKGLSTNVGGKLIFGLNSLLNIIYQEVLTMYGKDGVVTFVRYMDHYNVWQPELNMANAQELIDEIKDGLR